MTMGSSPLARGLLKIDPLSTVDTRDHPRSRGVYMLEQLFGDRPEGSSPLARGLPRRRDVEFGGPGIIPARAGFTDHSGAVRGRGEDHPRSRGVYKSCSSM